MTAAERGIRRRQRLFVVFTAVLVLAYARQLVNAPTAGQDFRAFFAAATLAAHGGDPYDWTALGHTEEALYNSPGHIRVGDAAYYDFLPYPEGPWLALALEPLTGLSWRAVYPIFAALMLLAIAAGSWLILSRLGWPSTRRRIGVVVATLSPIVFFNIFQGQVTALVFLGFAAAWYLAWRGHPVAGGLALTLVWIKPNLGLALPLVVALLEPAAARRLLLTFAAGSVLAFVAAAQRGWGDATTEATVWAFAIIPFAYFVGWHVFFFNGFTAIPVALLLLAWHRRVVIPRLDEIAEVRAA